MKKIALIGSNGQLGSDIIACAKDQKDFSITPLTHQDIAIENPQSVRSVLDSIAPDMVISTAAFHRVDDIEKETEKAFEINAIATKKLAQYCEEKKASLVFFSSDYVFGQDAKRSTPYTEQDLPGPLSSYGISKLAGEHFALAYCSKAYVIRSSGLYGKKGSSGKGGNFVQTILQKAKAGEELRVVNDQVLTPTFTKDLANQVIVILKNEKPGLYHATNEGGCSWFEFTKEILSIANLDLQVVSITSDQYRAPAKRPHYSVLKNEKLKNLGINIMRDWKIALKEYLQSIQ